MMNFFRLIVERLFTSTNQARDKSLRPIRALDRDARLGHLHKVALDQVFLLVQVNDTLASLLAIEEGSGCTEGGGNDHGGRRGDGLRSHSHLAFFKLIAIVAVGREIKSESVA